MASGVESMPMAASRENWKSVAFRYSLALLTVFAALLIQGIVQRLLPAGFDFPYAFFYLLAAFVTAWFGGYGPGALACLVVIVGFPAASLHFAHLPPVDFSRLAVFVGVSLFVSRIAETQRRAREALRMTNDELDRRARDRTRELGLALERVEAEVAGHRRTEAALRESEERTEFALEAAGIGRLEMNLETGAVDRSPRHDQIFGFAELLPKWTRNMLLDHVVPEDRALVAQRIDDAGRSGSVCEFECRIKTPDNALRWISVRGKIRQRESDRAASMVGIITDISGRKFGEERLRTHLERLNLLDQITRAIGERQDLPSVFQVVIRTLEDHLPVDLGCICLYDDAAETLTISAAGARGGTLEADLGMTPESRIAIDQNGLLRCVHGQLVYEQDLHEVNFPFPQRLARAGLLAMVAAPLQVESRVFGVLIVARRERNSFSSGECEFLRQLSEHVGLAVHQAQIYTALQRAYEDLRQSQHSVMQQERLRALGQMASGIAHDINNALSPVSLYTESLLEGEPGLSNRARQYLGTIQQAIDDVAQTVARMREFYRQQEPQLTLMPVDLGRLVHQVVDLTRARWNDMPQQRGLMVHLRIELAPRLPAVAGVESEIREALTNLILNAVDAMPEGGTLSLRTRGEQSGPEAEQVVVEVADTGIGMDEQTRKRCLEPFFTTKGERGTGLGLAMVYGVVQRHNAQIEIDSAPGSGTTMRLRFPPMAVTDGKIQAELPDLIPGRLRILVVDDDPLLIKSLRDTLESDGHVVVTASGGKEGIDAFKAAEVSGERFAVVLTDLGMPYVDGRRVASAIKAASPSTPVILLTGWGQRLVAEGGVPAHVDRVLNKPPRLRELRAALAEVTRTPAAETTHR